MQAVCEAVLPRQSGDAIPKTLAGILVAVADRLDSLVGLWAAGEAPRSSADPFGLRRSAYGMLQVYDRVTFHTTLKLCLLSGSPKAEGLCLAVTKPTKHLIGLHCEKNSIRALAAEALL